MRRLGLALTTALLLLTACERKDNELEDNPSLIDPDRGRRVTTSQPSFTTKRRVDTKRVVKDDDDTVKARTTTEVPQYNFQKGAAKTTSQPSSGPVGPGQREAGVLLETDDCDTSYRLVTLYKERRAFLLKADGTRLHTWQDGDATTWESTRMMPNGDLVVIGARGSRQRRGLDDNDRYVERRKWSGERTWRMAMFARGNIALRPDGQIAVIHHEFRDDAELGEGVRLRDDLIATLDADGRETSSFSLHEVISGSDLEIAEKSPRNSTEGRWVNLYNATSLDWGTNEDPQRLDYREHVLVTLQNQDMVIVVDTRSKTIKWSYTGAGVAGPYSGQFLDSGNVLVFEKGLDRKHSRAYEVNPASRRSRLGLRRPG